MYNVKILSVTYLTLSAVYLSASSPLPSGNIKLDQRQEGEWNVRADLENFVILLIPTNVNSGLASLGLLDLLRKAPAKKPIKLNKKNEIQQIDDHQHQESLVSNDQQTQTIDNSAIETQHFIESKTAPYHVDISKSRNNLAKLHPQFENGEDLLVAHSPSISLLKNADVSDSNSNKLGRLSRAYFISIPVNEAKILKSKHSNNKELKEADNWHLLGDGTEECGPGLRRDSQGICRTIPQ